MSLLRYVPSTNRSGISDTAGSACGITPVILTPAELAEELRSPVAKSLGLSPRTVFLHFRGLQKCFDPRYHLSRKEQVIGARISISLRLDHYIPGPNRTPAAIVCSWPPSSRPREIRSKARPKPSAKAVSAVPRGLRQRLRQLIFARKRTLLTAKPSESLPSA